MENVLVKLVVVFAVLTSAPVTFAQSGGQANIPHFYAVTNSDGTYAFTTFYISNRASTPVDVKVKLYRKMNTSGSPTLHFDSTTDGTNGYIRSTATVSTNNYSETTTGYSATLTLPGFDTVTVQAFDPISGSKEYGYGSIEWSTSQEGVFEPLLVYGMRTFNQTVLTAGYSMFYIPINNSLPF